MTHITKVCGIFTKAAVICLALLGGQPAHLRAQEIPGLNEINGRVETLENEHSRLSQRHRLLERDLKRSREDIDVLRKQEESLKTEIAVAAQESAELTRDIDNADKEIFRVERVSLERLKAFYKFSPRAAFNQILAVNAISLPRLSIYLRRLHEFDKGVVARYLQLQADNVSRRDDLLRLQRRTRDLYAATQKRTAELSAKLKEQELIAREIKLHKERIAAALTGLRAQALRLETVVASLTGAEEDANEHRRRIPLPESEQKSGDAFPGKGLQRVRQMPVMGVLIQNFGKQPSEFKDFVFSKGNEYKTPPGAPVRAISDGRVMFLGRMPGYGTIVILDHGSRSYSLYGRLGKTDVQAGEPVRVGQEIAISGEPDDKGRSFYFEIRENGKPVDPAKYLPQ